MAEVRQYLSVVVSYLVQLLYKNINQTLLNKCHGPMHYNLGVTCVYNGHVLYTLVLY